MKDGEKVEVVQSDSVESALRFQKTVSIEVHPLVLGITALLFLGEVVPPDGPEGAFHAMVRRLDDLELCPFMDEISRQPEILAILNASQEAHEAGEPQSLADLLSLMTNKILQGCGGILGIVENGKLREADQRKRAITGYTNGGNSRDRVLSLLTALEKAHAEATAKAKAN